MNFKPLPSITRTLGPLAIAGVIGTTALIAGCDDDGDAPAGAAASDDAMFVTIAHTTDDHAGDETCFICDPSKRDEGRLWCTEHARYEDRCWACQPQLEDPDRLWCKEHALYEDECHLCDPSRGADPSATPADGKVNGEENGESAALFCNEHNVPEAECGICQPQRAEQLAAGESLKIRMASARSADLAGVATQRPTAGRSESSLEFLGEVRYDGNHRARVTPLASGVMTEVLVDVGETVEAGQALATVNSAGVADAKAAYLSALATAEVTRSAHERESRLVEENISAKREAEAAEAGFKLADLNRRKTEQALLNLGFSPSDVASVADTGSSSSDLIVRAPFAGTVVGREAVLGEAVEPGDALFEVADLSTMWVELAVPEEHAAALRPGMPVVARVKALPTAEFRGELLWLSPQIDEQTRMVRARAIVPNDEGVLRHGMFAQVITELSDTLDALTLPGGAVQDIDGLSFVFVRSEPDLYEARRVEVASAANGRVAVAGIGTDDDVVTAGGFTMKTEFLKSRLGAGCVDD
ncbi:MAG: efflux RND transporter periplasmic adaptor subunit [Planctomycetota bacterium]